MQVGCQCSLKAIGRYCNVFNTAACGTTCFVLLALPRNTHAKLVVRVMKQMRPVHMYRLWTLLNRSDAGVVLFAICDKMKNWSGKLIFLSAATPTLRGCFTNPMFQNTSVDHMHTLTAGVFQQEARLQEVLEELLDNLRATFFRRWPFSATSPWFKHRRFLFSCFSISFSWQWMAPCSSASSASSFFLETSQLSVCFFVLLRCSSRP